MDKKKIPYGTSNYESLIMQNYYFVDKTKYIELLEKQNNKNIFFLRPRKFGKSLFISILEYYYGFEHKNIFQSLFGDLYIGKNPTEYANSYYVIKFDFSGINTSTKESTFNNFRIKVIDGILAFNNNYKLFNPEEMNNFDKIEGASELLTSLLRLFDGKKLSNKLYVLIDEYDYFTNELFSFRITEFKDIVSRNGYVRKFYEVIKTGVGEGIIDRFFATGVTPITMDSLTSGFNIGTDLTSDPQFNEMLGFTNDEVLRMLQYYEIENSEIVLKDLERLYNGSLFSIEAHQRVYNSNMVLFFFNSMIIHKKYPKDLIDQNISSDYSKIRSIFRLNDTEEQHQKLNEILTLGETTALLTKKFSFERDFTIDDFISLLFYNGLLTIKEEYAALLVFQIPNYAIKEIYWDFFKNLLETEHQLHFNISELRKAFTELALNNNIQGWITQIENVMELLSNRDLQNFDEKYVKMLFITLASLSQLYIIKSEAEVKGEYPDLMYLYRKPYKPNFQFLIELKYLKKSESRKLKKTMQMAIDQVKKYLDKPEIKNLENLKSYAVVFLGKKGYFESCDD